MHALSEIATPLSELRGSADDFLFCFLLELSTFAFLLSQGNKMSVSCAIFSPSA